MQISRYFYTQTPNFCINDMTCYYAKYNSLGAAQPCPILVAPNGQKQPKKGCLAMLGEI